MRNFGDLEPFLAPQGFSSTIKLQVIDFHCVQGGLWCVTESLFFSSKQTVTGMNGKYRVYFGQIYNND